MNAHDLKISRAALIALCAALAFSAPGAVAQSGNAQDLAVPEPIIPDWIQKLFAFYADGQISDGTLLAALAYLVDEGILTPSGAAAGHAALSSDSGIGTAGHASARLPDARPESSRMIEDAGDFYITYGPNPNSPTPEYTARDWLQDAELIEPQIEFLNEYFALPHDVEISARECGVINAFYDPETKKVVMCYELVNNLFDSYHYYYPEDYDEYSDFFTSDVLTYIFYHEIAHALIDIYHLPTTGIEEDAADQFAALMLSYIHDDEINYTVGQEMLYNVGTWFYIADDYWTNIHPYLPENWLRDTSLPYWAQHRLDIQRYYNISCYAYGADPDYNHDLIEEGWLPEERAVSCEYEYQHLEYSWGELLKSYSAFFE